MKLQDYIDSYGIKKTVLARILKVHRGTIYRICSGNTPNLRLAKKIQTVTRGEVTVQDLLQIEPEPVFEGKGFIKLDN